MTQPVPFKTLAIIACGLGKRVSLFTGSNYIPKLLLSIGGKTILGRIIESATSFDAFCAE
jgi:NDP-sugar pyrophosphorylase family protein